MRSQLLHDGHLMLDLDRDEHRAVSAAVSAVMAALEPGEIENVLDVDVDAAYEIQYSVYLCESAARLAGIGWLPAGEFDDALAVGMGIRPCLDIRFDGGGSAWRLDRRQLRFLEACIAFHAGAGSPADGPPNWGRQGARPRLPGDPITTMIT